MGLTATAAAAAAQGFAAAGDALKAVRLRLNPAKGAFDPDTDAQTVTYAQDTAGVDALGYDDKKIADKIGSNVIGKGMRTRSFLVLGSSVTIAQPNSEGILTDDQGTNWEISGVESDPTAAIYIFHCTT